MTQAVILGHSHCNAIAAGLLQKVERWSGISVYRLEDKRAKDRSIAIPAAIKLIGDLPPDAHVFLAILGAYHNILGLLRSGDAFDVIMGAAAIPDPEAMALVPQRAMLHALGEQFALSGKLRNLIAAARGPVFLISSPPPKRSNEYILDRFMRQKKQIYRGKSVRQFGIERPELRLKLWLLETRLMADWADSFGAQFLPAPTAALDPDGFLSEAYYGDDVTHANAAYGALVLDQVAAIVSGSSKQVSHG